ncbi:hypothetical protein MIND_00634900 [Mycena indigotica]|uniref:F-box domain-containing protein n=1 Tax=Mycena indigotica TaxID=2126181 RepID=A0A8H6W5Y6_9AGAR|nr:uncharacterized protein MIND_00634900 [Mycena indigotica]KAF7304036.1 hypothetical protein MIND_00634900 [Mycena indigotica]
MSSHRDSRPLQLLDLPAELVHTCLLPLSLSDLAHCLHTGNRVLAEIISSSLAIRYRVAQELAGVSISENRTAQGLRGLDTASRLTALDARERRWREFSPLSRHTIPYPRFPVMLYAIDAGRWLAAEAGTGPGMQDRAVALHYTELAPGNGKGDADSEARWRTVFTGTPFANFSTALVEHDLLVIITVVPCADDPAKISLDALMLSFSTGAPHPMASSSTIHIERRTVLDAVTDVAVEIVGDILAISLMNAVHSFADSNRLHVFDWKRGVTILTPTPITSIGIMFLAPGVILVPNAADNGLDVYLFPPFSPSPLDQQPVQLLLPALAPRTVLPPMEMHCRQSPNPRLSTEHPHLSPVRFPPAADAAAVFISYETEQAVDERFTGTTTQTHLFVLQPKPMLAVIRAARARTAGVAPGDPAVVPWTDWGARCTRWLDPVETAPAMILASEGQRLLSYPPFNPRGLAGRPPQSLRMFDFNPRRVAAARRTSKLGAGVRLVEAGPLPPELCADFAEAVGSGIAYVESTAPEGCDFDNAYLSEECIIGRKYEHEKRRGERLEVWYFG